VIVNQSSRSLRILPFVLLVCVGVSLVCVIYPMYVIRPFRAQGPRELAMALEVARFRPAVTMISAIAAVLAVFGYFLSKPRKWRRVAAVAGAAFVVLLAVLGRVNVYEVMFHPVGQPSFAAASQVKLDKDEKVIAVKIGSSARAYPIRSISFHHVVNDVVDGRAIVATY
jgi:hypothetical protein